MSARRSAIPLTATGLWSPVWKKEISWPPPSAPSSSPERAPQGKVLLRCFVGGAKNEAIVSWRDAKLFAAVKKDIEEILEIKGAPLLTRIYRWPKAMPQYSLGHEERLSRIEQGLAKHPGIFLTGSAYHGVGISDCVHEAELLAEQVLEFIKK